MTKQLKKGDQVSWDTLQGRTSGKVVRKLTSTTKIKGYTAKASERHPEYLVQSAKSGKRAAHRPGELKKR